MDKGLKLSEYEFAFYLKEKGYTSQTAFQEKSHAQT